MVQTRFCRTFAQATACGSAKNVRRKPDFVSNFETANDLLFRVVPRATLPETRVNPACGDESRALVCTLDLTLEEIDDPLIATSRRSSFSGSKFPPPIRLIRQIP